MDAYRAKSRAALAVAALVAVTSLSLFTAASAEASVLTKRRAGAEALKAARYIAKDDPKARGYGYSGCERRSSLRVACLAIVNYKDKEIGRYLCTARIVTKLNDRTGRVSSHYANGSAECFATE
jgi:hypothetical protein